MVGGACTNRHQFVWEMRRFGTFGLRLVYVVWAQPIFSRMGGPPFLSVWYLLLGNIRTRTTLCICVGVAASMARCNSGGNRFPPGVRFPRMAGTLLPAAGGVPVPHRALHVLNCCDADQVNVLAAYSNQ